MRTDSVGWQAQGYPAPHIAQFQNQGGQMSQQPMGYGNGQQLGKGMQNDYRMGYPMNMSQQDNGYGTMGAFSMGKGNMGSFPGAMSQGMPVMNQGMQGNPMGALTSQLGQLSIDKGKGKGPCRFGTSCTRPDCWFTHDGMTGPNETGKGARQCRFGTACTRADCYFSHPEGRVLPSSGKGGGKGETPCRFGDKCTRSDCVFMHEAKPVAVVEKTSAVSKPSADTDDEEERIMEMMQEGMFYTQYAKCDCCKGYIDSCKGTPICIDLGRCACAYEHESDDDSPANMRDTWVPAHRECACCEGFIYRCSGASCKGVCVECPGL